MQRRIKFWVMAAALMLPACAHVAPAQQQGEMKYLVSGEFIDPGPTASPGLMSQIMKNAVLTSLDTLAQWERDNRISGGILVGERAGAFVIKARSNQEVDQLLEQLPFWTFLKWKVSPLNSFSSRAAQDRMTVERMDRLMEGKK